MGILTETEQRAAVVAEALTWIGTPFHFNACQKHVGVACGPFLIASYKPYSEDSGRPLPIAPTFGKDWHFHTKEEKFLNVVTQFCAEVETPQMGDVALFRLGSKDRPYSHGAIIIDWPLKMVHSMWRSGVELTTAHQLPLRPELARFFSPWSFE